MERILCLGNNTEDTDTRTRNLAAKENMPCHGLLSELDGDLSQDSYHQTGFYHSSIYDVSFGNLEKLANQFDRVIMLDQPKPQWSHPDAFYNTIRLMKTLQVPAIFLDPGYQQDIDFFENLVNTNKSFCIFPFIELLANGDHSTVCCRSNTPVARIDDTLDFQRDQNYVKIRQAMIEGTQLPEHCDSCYRVEKLGILSARQQETVEWSNRLGLTSLEDLAKISKPAYYEIRSSNKCNLLCRMCNPSLSHQIDREYRRIGIVAKDAPPARSYEFGFDLVDFDNLKKLYVSGGEPLIMPEFYDFLDKCIKESRTDFELLINTNGTKLSEKFKKQIRSFSNLQFIFSIDGYEKLNHYIRWPSDWDTIVGNLQYLRDHGHKVSVNTTVSIYNVAHLHELFEFLDHRFRNTLIHVQLAESPLTVSPWLYPDRQKAIDSLCQIKDLPCYHNDQLFASSIDGYISKFQNLERSPDLSGFFKFNDQLDQSRSIRLVDYLPDIEIYRKTN